MSGSVDISAWPGDTFNEEAAPSPQEALCHEATFKHDPFKGRGPTRSQVSLEVSWLFIGVSRFPAQIFPPGPRPLGPPGVVSTLGVYLSNVVMCPPSALQHKLFISLTVAYSASLSHCLQLSLTVQ